MCAERKREVLTELQKRKEHQQQLKRRSHEKASATTRAAAAAEVNPEIKSTERLVSPCELSFLFLFMPSSFSKREEKRECVCGVSKHVRRPEGKE